MRFITGLAMLLCGSLGPTACSGGESPTPAATTPTPPATWTVVFRSDDPTHWDTDTGIDAAAAPYAVKLDPAGTSRFVRLRRMDTGEYVILAVEALDLHHRITVGRYVWNGEAQTQSKKRPGSTQVATNTLLGIADTKQTAGYKDPGVMLVGTTGRGTHYKGWGFGRAPLVYSDQLYGWDGKRIDKTAFEIAVTGDEPGDEEQTHVLK